MPRSIFNTYGSVDVRDIELEHLQAAYAEALKRGDIAQCAIIKRNLRLWSNSNV